MDITKVNQEDGRNCAHLVEVVQFATKLLDAFKVAGITVSGPGLNNRDTAARWLGAIAHNMAVDLRKQESEKPMVVKHIAQPQKLTSPKNSKTNKKSKK